MTSAETTRLKHKARRRRTKRHTFGLLELLFIILSWSLIGYCLDSWTSSFLAWYVRSVVAMAAISVLILAKNLAPLHEFYSIRLRGLFLAGVAGILFGFASLGLEGSDRLGGPTILIWTVVLGPPLEELLMRGVLLSSLRPQVGGTFALLGVSCFAGLVHDHFWPSFLIQAGFGLVYLVSERSLTLSTIAHAVTNFIIDYPSWMR